MAYTDWTNVVFKVKDTENEELTKELEYCEYYFFVWAEKRNTHELYIEVPKAFYGAVKEHIKPFLIEIG